MTSLGVCPAGLRLERNVPMERGNIVYDGENFYLAQGTTGKIAQRYYAVAALCGDDLEEYRKEFNQAWESDESASDEDEKNL